MSALRTSIDWRGVLWNYIQLTVGAALLIITFNLFIAPTALAPGGVSGLTVIINHFTGWPNGLTMLFLNIPSVVLGFFYLGRFQFLVRTLYVVLLYNIAVDWLSPMFPAGGISGDLMLNALYGGVLGGLGTGLVYRGRGTAAGSGIISRVLQLKTGIPINQFYIMIDGGIIAALGLTFGWEKALYALVMLFVWGVATDYVLEGPSVIRTAFIVTDKPQEVAGGILSRLRIGLTAWPGQGMFTEVDHVVLFCTISRPDVNTLKEIVTELDPEAFIVIGQGHRAMGGKVKHDLLKRSAV